MNPSDRAHDSANFNRLAASRSRASFLVELAHGRSLGGARCGKSQRAVHRRVRGAYPVGTKPPNTQVWERHHGPVVPLLSARALCPILFGFPLHRRRPLDGKTPFGCTSGGPDGVFMCSKAKGSPQLSFPERPHDSPVK
jgi:hypothetical protein